MKGLFDHAEAAGQGDGAESRNVPRSHLLEAVSAHYPGSLLIADKDRTILYANHAMARISGYAIEELIGQPLSLLHAPDLTDEWHRQVAEAIESQGMWKGEIEYRHKNGDPYREHKTIAAILDDGGRLQYTFSIGEDLTSRTRLERQIDQLMLFDHLTGLPNRAAFARSLAEGLESARAGRRELGVLHVDFDYFKNIDSIIGHGGADHVMMESVSRIRELLRPSDLLARAASDEFLVMREGQGQGLEADCHALATQILEELRNPYFFGGETIDLTASIGIAIYPGAGMTAEMVLANALQATKKAKSEGGNDWRQYEPAMAMSEGWRRDLRQAIERNEMLLFFQPQVSLFSGGIVGLEALLRWRHPALGMVPPGKFIPVAEESNFIITVGEWVLNEACRQMREWLDAGLPPIKVAVNLAARHFRKTDLPSCIRRATEAWRIDPRFIEIEITESAMMQDIAAAKRNMSQLNDMGVRIALDDFGTGYSSMAYLSRFPIDVVKIDQSFICDITTNPANAAIAQATIAMSHKLGKVALAEGVETADQVQYLRRSECDEMQGYYFAKPCPAADIATMLRKDVRLSLSGAVTDNSQRVILIVDDEVNILASLRRILRREGYTILTAGSIAEAFSMLASHKVQVVISDQHMPGLTGTDFLAQVKAMYPETVRMVLSAYSDISTVTDAINKGAAYRFLTKPWNDEQIKEEIRGALRHWRELYARDLV